MKIILVGLGLVLCVYSLPTSFEGGSEVRAPALPCNATTCKLPNCYCSSTDIPNGLAPNVTPQFVVLTFDDAVSPTNIDFYREAFNNRTNPNNCPISTTYFISHEYCDYEFVHELYSKGHEIALHSFSHEPNTAYWKDASVETLVKEIAEQRQAVARFANLSAADIKGIRMPFLQLAGNNQYKMLKDNNFLYDLSWSTQSFIQPGMWPYTLDHLSQQDCFIPPCPEESFPGLWVMPMINWIDNDDVVCSMADACVNIPNNTNGVLDWMKREFDRQYKGNRAPVGLYLHSAWFLVNEVHYEAYKKFLDYLGTLKDVFIVSASQVIDWMKAPKTIAQMNTFPCPKTSPISCTPRSCELIKEEGITRWMKSCASQCPNSYPWVGNPLGEKPVNQSVNL